MFPFSFFPYEFLPTNLEKSQILMQELDPLIPHPSLVSKHLPSDFIPLNQYHRFRKSSNTLSPFIIHPLS